MNLILELRQRRVPQITSGYIVGSWGLIQFFDFLENRMAVSPNLVNLVGLCLIFLLPSVVVTAWVHGRPGRDTWGRIPKVIIPVNLLAAVMILFLLFKGQELSVTTQIIEVQDEHGNVTERVVPKSQFVHRIMLFYPENIGDAENNWSREVITWLQGFDLDQDHFVEPLTPFSMINAMENAGSDNGHGLSRPQMRKLVQDRHLPYFLTGTIDKDNNTWIFESKLHHSESGRVLATRRTESDNLFTLADLTSRQVREDLGISSAHLESNPDLPISELSSNDIEAMKKFLAGQIAAYHENDWEKAAPLIEEVVRRDPDFTMAHFLLSLIYRNIGQNEKSAESMALAMNNLYRIPECTGFMIKSQYYLNVVHDSKKSMAVLKMWSQIYPNDVDVYSMQAFYYVLWQDLPKALTAYQKILSLDSSQVSMYRKIADLHQQMGNNEEAEKCYLQYVESFPFDIEGYRGLSGFYRIGGQFKKAQGILEKAQLVDPSNFNLALSLVDLDVQMGRFDEATLTLEAKLDIARTKTELSAILGRQVKLYRLLGRVDLLNQKLDSLYSTFLADKTPLQANLVFGAALFYISAPGQPAATLQRLDTLAAKLVSPNDQVLGVSRAWALVHLGRIEEAKTALEEASEAVEILGFETYKPNIYFLKGMILEAEGDFPTAISNFRTALETAPKKHMIYSYRLARAMRKNGQTDAAIKFLESALKISPENPEYHLEMALTLYESGKSDKAREHLTKAQNAWKNAHPDFLSAQIARELAKKLG